jgi:hypothetical protein
MTSYLFLVQNGTDGRDTQNDFSIVIQNKRAQYLSDFIGGKATFTDGYSAQMTKYDVTPCSYDSQRLDLIPNEADKFIVRVHPDFKRLEDQSLQALPLQIGQKISIQFGEHGMTMDFRVKNLRFVENTQC